MHHHALILKHPPDHPAPPSRLLSSSTYLPLLSTTYSNLSLLQHLLVDSPHDNYDALVLCSKRSVDALAEIHYDPSLHPATKHFCVGPSTKTHLVDHVASDPSQVNVETSRNERATADLLAHKIIEWCRTSSSSSSTSTTTTADPHDVDDAESSTALPRPLDSSTTTMTTTTTGSQSTRTKTTRTKRILFLTGDKTRDSLARILRSHSRSSSSSSSHTTSNSTSNPTSISNSKDDDDELAEEPLLELETLQVYETTYRPEFERDLVDKLHEIDRLETTSRRRRNDQDRTMMTIAEEQQDERPVDANNEDYKVYLACCSPSGAKHVCSILRRHRLLPSLARPRSGSRSSSPSSQSSSSSSPARRQGLEEGQSSNQDERTNDDDDDQEVDEEPDRRLRRLSSSSSSSSSRDDRALGDRGPTLPRPDQLAFVSIGPTTTSYLERSPCCSASQRTEPSDSRGLSSSSSPLNGVSEENDRAKGEGGKGKRGGGGGGGEGAGEGGEGVKVAGEAIVPGDEGILRALESIILGETTTNDEGRNEDGEEGGFPRSSESVEQG